MGLKGGEGYILSPRISLKGREGSVTASALQLVPIHAPLSTRRRRRELLAQRDRDGENEGVIAVKQSLPVHVRTIPIK